MNPLSPMPDREAVSHRVHTPDQAGSTPAPATHDVCPHCKREVTAIQRVECDGHSFPVLWHCPEHGAVSPMRSAVVNHYPAPVTDWSAA